MSGRNQFDAFLRMDYRGEKGFLGRQPISIGDFVHNDNGTLGNMPVVASGKVGLAFASKLGHAIGGVDHAVGQHRGGGGAAPARRARDRPRGVDRDVDRA